MEQVPPQQPDNTQAASAAPPTLTFGGNATVASAEAATCIARSHSGANWFFWIAGLSLVNSIIVLAGGRWSFLAGLGVTQIIDALAGALSGKLGAGATAFALFLDLCAAGVIVLFGLLARQRHTWAFVLGMILYALDGLLFLIVQDWLSLAFHAYALYCISRGLMANRRLLELESTGELSRQTA
jgi:hypothetical protein